MEKEIQETRNCGNCKHIVRYYIKAKDRFRPVFCGTCPNKHDKKIIKITDNSVCGNWEDAELKKNDQTDSLKATLQKLAKRINEAIDVLKDENG